MKISEVALQYNLSIHTLRYYEKEGLLIPSRNQANNQNDLNRLDFIVKCVVLIHQLWLLKNI